MHDGGLARAPQWLRHVVKFATVGLAGAAVDYGGLQALIGLGLSPAVARVPAALVALVCTWVMNRNFTFQTRARPSLGEFRRYALAALTGIAINVSIYWLALWLGAAIWLAFVVGTGVSAVYTFLRYRRLLHDR